MASLFYNNYFEELGKGNIKFGTDTFYAMLVTTSYTPDKDSHAFRSDISGEASGAGYIAGGQALSNVTITQDNTNDRANIDFDNETFSAITVSDVNAYVVYKSTGNAATDILICYIEFDEGAQSTVAGDFTVIPPAGGAFSIG
jgi:hypothetical protein